MKQLVLGCGNYRKKRIFLGNDEYDDPVFLDINPDVNPDIVWDLNEMPLPFETNEFDEIHAYDVLEHIGTQGDWKRFFYEFGEYYRILKNKGLFFISCPARESIWAWGDPGHSRLITKETISYLNQDKYLECDKTQMTDYRFIYKGDFKLISDLSDSEANIFILGCIKSE